MAYNVQALQSISLVHVQKACLPILLTLLSSVMDPCNIWTSGPKFLKYLDPLEIFYISPNIMCVQLYRLIIKYM